MHSMMEDYPEMLYSNNMLPIITKPTRITGHTASLIDHICSNSLNQQVVSGIATVDILYHLPVFCTIDVSVEWQKYKMTFRDYSNLMKNYMGDVRAIDWNMIHRKCNSLQEHTAKTIEAITVIVDKHVPMKTMSSNKKKWLKKTSDNKWYTKVNKS